MSGQSDAVLFSALARGAERRVGDFIAQDLADRQAGRPRDRGSPKVPKHVPNKFRKRPEQVQTSYEQVPKQF